MLDFRRTCCVLLATLLTSASLAQDLTRWQPLPTDWKGAAVADGSATLTGDKWSFLLSPDGYTAMQCEAEITIEQPAKQFGFFGSSWSVWPDRSVPDGGFEAAIVVRAGKGSGYRVEWSHKYQELALVKVPEGGYVQSVYCPVKLGEPQRVRVSVAGSTIEVDVDGQPRIRYVDRMLPLEKGRVGIGVSSQAKVRFANVKLTELPNQPRPTTTLHTPRFSMRRWIGGRPWVFDGDEPIMLLPAPESTTINNVKLRPGYKPLLSWNSHWDTQNQGAYKEAENTSVNVKVIGGGETLVASWRGKHVKDRFATTTTMTVGFDRDRGTYTYDIDSQLEVFAGGEPFHFRYGYDFEHHTPLDPFRWQYVVAMRRGGELYHRPVYPIDPGPQNDLEPYNGLRVWYGRHGETMQVAPAVEYEIRPEWHVDPLNAGKTLDRKLNTAVCAAFYDTGVSFAPETAPPGTKVRVKYRYTGYPADEAERLFRQSKIYDSPTLDPNHYYIFADQWPKLTFEQFVPLSETWIYGRTPFMTAHNTRPTYELQENCGAGGGFAMKLGPASFGKARLPVGDSLAKGRYLVTALVKSINAHGPGGRIELEATQAKTNKALAAATHFVGNGTFDWTRQGFVFDVPEDASALTVAFGNAGTGEMLVTDVEFRRLNDGDAAPTGVAARPKDKPPAYSAAPAGAIHDYRMEEGRGYHVFNYAGGLHLDLANIEWVVDEGRPAIRFAEPVGRIANPSAQDSQGQGRIGNPSYDKSSGLYRNYFSHPGYANRDTLPIALSGHHGGGAPMKGLTLAAWIKPAAEMGRSEHRGKGDVIGYGARRFILSLHNQTAPYQLAARLNVNDRIVSDTQIAADRWHHVAMTAEPSAGQWHVRLFVNGKQVGEGHTKNFPADSVIVPSLILGVEIFYFHDAYYRGLIGRTLVFNRPLTAGEIAELAK
jgi:hypothetical protein